MILMARVTSFASRVRSISKNKYATGSQSVAIRPHAYCAYSDGSLIQELQFHRAQIEVFLLCIHEYFRNIPSGLSKDNDMLSAMTGAHLYVLKRALLRHHGS
jgi:hypothetical protein